MKEAITPDVSGAVDSALVGVRRELAPAVSVDQRAHVMMALGRYMGIGGGGWPAEQREEWISCAEEEFSEFPMGLVMDGIARARRRVRFASEFVPWVLTYIEEAVDKLRREEAMIAQLQAIARS